MAAFQPRSLRYTGLSSLRDESLALYSGVGFFQMNPVTFKDLSRLIDEWEMR